MASGRSENPASSAGGQLPESDPTDKPFTPDILDRTLVSLPLLDRIRTEGLDAVQNVIIDVNLDFPGGRKSARALIEGWVDEIVAPARKRPRRRAGVAKLQRDQGINRIKSEYSQQYLFGRLSGHNIQALARRSREDAQETTGTGTAGKEAPRPTSALYRIWLDHEVHQFVSTSISTVKADAARNAFGAMGHDIVWAVVDTGIDATHPHFQKHQNLQLDAPLRHRDFTSLENLDAPEPADRALVDRAGHGTHVAGIIAGEIGSGDGYEIRAEVRLRDETGEVERRDVTFPTLSGMAPRCKLLSLKVLDDRGSGLASNLIAAVEYIQELNGNGRRIRVHGVNMSVGYDFEPAWFACGQSPLCVEVDRLVRSGVVVVVAAGNTGYGVQNTQSRGPVASGIDLTINDPGNAELAITVGATHREMPHIFGVSYFSSKGPTGDGRLKPDLVAPGEKIISCATGMQAAPADAGAAPADAPPVARYKEDSGTSMAAPHVSGVIAAFLSVRREFIGQPENVKAVFLSTATDLKRAVYFQGKGLVDLMRAIQSV